MSFAYQFIYVILAKYNFLKTFRKFKIENDKYKIRFDLKWKDRYPCLFDNTSTTGFDRHYIYHLAWASRLIKMSNPSKHVDISSSLYFCSILSAFIPVEFYDYRPANLVLSGLNSERADLLHLHFPDNSISSISCMHTVEHVGLGRYGDSIDYEGDLKAMSELARVLAIDGNLFFVVPIGDKSIIQFNAHRIYTKNQVIEHFNSLNLELKEFTLIPENGIDGGLVLDPSIELLSKQKYSCGCFLFTRHDIKDIQR